MRDLVAALVAAALIFTALSLLTTLHFYRKRHRAARDQMISRGRTIIAELPTDPELTLFTEDDERFYYGATPIAKRDIMTARVLINGSPIATFVAPGARQDVELAAETTSAFEDHAEGILRDRWDVEVRTRSGVVLIECGSVRERVSQELARTIFDAITTRLRNDRRDD